MPPATPSPHSSSATAPTGKTKRTRDGCYTCKKRRIKCDEQKPECLNCIKSKRVCEGYRPKFEFRDGLNNNTKIGKLVNGMVQQQGQQGQPHHHSHSSMHHHHNYYQQNDMPYPQNQSHMPSSADHGKELKFVSCSNLQNIVVEIPDQYQQQQLQHQYQPPPQHAHQHAHYQRLEQQLEQQQHQGYPSHHQQKPRYSQFPPPNYAVQLPPIHVLPYPDSSNSSISGGNGNGSSGHINYHYNSNGHHQQGTPPARLKLPRLTSNKLNPILTPPPSASTSGRGNYQNPPY